MDYLKAFLVGGSICLLAQLFIDYTKLTPAKILVSFVVLGVILGGIGLYEPLVEFAGAGASASTNPWWISPEPEPRSPCWASATPWPKASGKRCRRTASWASSPAASKPQQAASP